MPIEDYYGQFAELVGAEERAAELHRRYQERLQEIRDLVGEPSQVVVSLIATGPSAEVGQIYTQHAANQVHTMLKEIGFARPAPQLDDDEGHTLSLERLPSQDGDLLLRYLDTGGALDTVEIATP